MRYLRNHFCFEKHIFVIAAYFLGMFSVSAQDVTPPAAAAFCGSVVSQLAINRATFRCYRSAGVIDGTRYTVSAYVDPDGWVEEGEDPRPGLGADLAANYVNKSVELLQKTIPVYNGLVTNQKVPTLDIYQFFRDIPGAGANAGPPFPYPDPDREYQEYSLVDSQREHLYEVMRDQKLCFIEFEPVQTYDVDRHFIERFLSHEIFHCYQYANFWGGDRYLWPTNIPFLVWIIEGSAEFFSNVVYPVGNTEWELWARSFSVERTRRPLDSGDDDAEYHSTFFFQHAATSLGGGFRLSAIDNSITDHSRLTGDGPKRLAEMLSAIEIKPTRNAALQEFSRHLSGPGGDGPSTWEEWFHDFAVQAVSLNIPDSSEVGPNAVPAGQRSAPYILTRHFLNWDPERRRMVPSSPTDVEGVYQDVIRYDDAQSPGPQRVTIEAEPLQLRRAYVQFPPTMGYNIDVSTSGDGMVSVKRVRMDHALDPEMPLVGRLPWTTWVGDRPTGGENDLPYGDFCSEQYGEAYLIVATTTTPGPFTITLDVEEKSEACEGRIQLVTSCAVGTHSLAPDLLQGFYGTGRPEDIVSGSMNLSISEEGAGTYALDVLVRRETETTRIDIEYQGLAALRFSSTDWRFNRNLHKMFDPETQLPSGLTGDGLSGLYKEGSVMFASALMKEVAPEDDLILRRSLGAVGNGSSAVEAAPELEIPPDVQEMIDSMPPDFLDTLPPEFAAMFPPEILDALGQGSEGVASIVRDHQNPVHQQDLFINEVMEHFMDDASTLLSGEDVENLADLLQEWQDSLAALGDASPTDMDPVLWAQNRRARYLALDAIAQLPRRMWVVNDEAVETVTTTRYTRSEFGWEQAGTPTVDALPPNPIFDFEESFGHIGFRCEAGDLQLGV